MCTVVVRWQPGAPAHLLALRDEVVGREFDDPGPWFAPGVVGGRDRVAGGTWCASDVAAGATALVLNRPERRVGTPSRGVLPLLALTGDWTTAVPLASMASFTLVLVTPDRHVHWHWDGTDLVAVDVEPGTVVVTSGGAERGKAERHLAAFTTSDVTAWRDLLQPPADDPAALVVRHVGEDRVFATVFGQQLVSRPGRLEAAWSREPWRPETWASATW